MYTNTVRTILNILFPRTDTVRRLETLSAHDALHTLPRSTKKLDHVCAVFAYRNPLTQTLIWQLKYKENKIIARLCGEIVQKILSEQFSTRVLLIPIPLSNARRRTRGFNQNELIIDHISQHYERTYVALKKIRHTVPQSSLSDRAARLTNISGCFSVALPELVHDRDIVLIDDVITTGSTLREARNTLLAAGAHEVRSIVLAH